MEYRGYRAVVTLDYEGALHGEVTGTLDVITFEGRSPDDLRDAFRDSVDEYLKVCEERGRSPR